MNKELDIQIRLQAAITQREGMLAKNSCRIRNGQSIADGEDAFQVIFFELSALAEENRICHDR